MIDKNKQYTTRCGLPVRIYATDGRGDCPVHGAMLDHEGWFDFSWTKEGKMFAGQTADTELDLIEIDCEQGEGL